MILQTYPPRLYFSSLRTVALSISSYDEFRWIQEHQDYSRLKQRYIQVPKAFRRWRIEHVFEAQLGDYFLQNSTYRRRSHDVKNPQLTSDILYLRTGTYDFWYSVSRYAKTENLEILLHT